MIRILLFIFMIGFSVSCFRLEDEVYKIMDGPRLTVSYDLNLDQDSIYISTFISKL